jgi:hypothetical protein
VYESGVHIAGHDNTTCSPACVLRRKCPEDKADINYKERQGYSDTRDHPLYLVRLSMQFVSQTTLPVSIKFGVVPKSVLPSFLFQCETYREPTECSQLFHKLFF